MKYATALATLLAVAMPRPAQSQLYPVDPDCDYKVWFIETLEVFEPDATDCAGAFKGNDVNQLEDVAAEIASQGWGTSPTYLGTTDAGDSDEPFSHVGGGIIGFVTFHSPLTGDYVLALKAANQFSLYYFAGLVNQSKIFYTTLGTAQNKKGIPQGLSHASLWSTGRTVSVPEPASAALLLTGLGGLGFVSIRRREQA
jgi:hypothetical protein